jgi:hypothetical protein
LQFARSKSLGISNCFLCQATIVDSWGIYMVNEPAFLFFTQALAPAARFPALLAWPMPRCPQQQSAPRRRIGTPLLAPHAPLIDCPELLPNT